MVIQLLTHTLLYLISGLNTYFALFHCVLVISLFPVPNGCGLIPFGPSGVAETAVR